ARFAGDPTACGIYRAVSEGFIPAGIEGWLPLFFRRTEQITDYLPERTGLVCLPDFDAALEASARGIASRHESLAHDIERPILAPDEAFFDAETTRTNL